MYNKRIFHCALEFFIHPEVNVFAYQHTKNDNTIWKHLPAMHIYYYTVKALP